MGTYYKGNADHYRSLSENLPSLKEDYPYSNGYFGSRGSSSSSKVRHIYSDNPQETAKDFYNKFAFGGIESPIYNKGTGDIKGKKTTLADGSIISWRNKSNSDGTPTIAINIERSSDNCGLKQQKIHFTKED